MLPVIVLPLCGLNLTATSADAAPSLTIVVSSSQTILPSLCGTVTGHDGHIERPTCHQVRTSVPRVGGTTALPKVESATVVYERVIDSREASRFARSIREK